MNAQKRIKRIAVVLVCFAAMALAGLNIYQHRQIQTATGKKPSVASNADESPAGPVPVEPATARRKAGRDHSVSAENSYSDGSEIDEILYQLDAATEELSMVNEQFSADKAEKAKRKELELELRKKYRESPSFRDAAKKSMDTQFADLFNKLNLSSEKRELFKDLVMENDFAQEDLFLGYGGTSALSKEQEEEFRQRSRALTEDYNLRVEALLGESDYATYRLYEETEGQRYRVNQFIEYLDSGEMLSGTQKESLIEAMHLEKKNVVYEEANDNDIERRITNNARNNEAYLKAANNVLSPSQLAKFKAYLEESSEQYATRLQMQALEDRDSES